MKDKITGILNTHLEARDEDSGELVPINGIDDAATRIMEQVGKCYVECGKDETTFALYSLETRGLRKYLKKLPPHPKEEPKDSGWISVEDIGPFAKWREDNRWFSFEDGKWKYTFEHGTMISNKSYEKNYTKTTAELFQMYGDSIIAAGLPPTVETKKD